jgi:hypothetical protein
MACGVVDRAMQAYGAEGLSQDQELASMFAQLRTLRLADVRLLFLHRPVLANAFFYRDLMRYVCGGENRQCLTPGCRFTSSRLGNVS